MKKADGHGELGDFCLLCRKCFTESHFENKYHQERMKDATSWVSEDDAAKWAQEYLIEAELAADAEGGGGGQGQLTDPTQPVSVGEMQFLIDTMANQQSILDQTVSVINVLLEHVPEARRVWTAAVAESTAMASASASSSAGTGQLIPRTPTGRVPYNYP